MAIILCVRTSKLPSPFCLIWDTETWLVQKNQAGVIIAFIGIIILTEVLRSMFGIIHNYGGLLCLFMKFKKM